MLGSPHIVAEDILSRFCKLFYMKKQNSCAFNKRGMYLKKAISLTVTLLAFLMLSVFSQNPGTTQAQEIQLVFATPYDFIDFNPFTSLTYVDAQWMSSILIGMFARTTSTNNRLSPVLASSYPIVELNGTNFISNTTQMRVTVTLKTGLMFSNGYPLNASDVKFTTQIMMSPLANSRAYGFMTQYFESNESIVILDEYTIRFDFKIRTGFYLSALSFAIVPKIIYEPAVSAGNYDFGADYWTFMVGAGPFYLESVDTSAGILSVVKNSYWYTTNMPDPQVDRIVFKKYADKTAAINDLQNGNVSIIDAQFIPLLGDIAGISGANYSIVESGGTQEMALNQIHPVWGQTAQLDAYLNRNFSTTNGANFTVHSFWYNLSNGSMDEATRVEAARLIREAMSYAMPRSRIVSQLFNGMGSSLATTTPPGSLGFDPNITPREYSLNTSMTKIIQAFNLAGWNNLTTDASDTSKVYVGSLGTMFSDWSMTLLCPNTNPDRIQWATWIQTELQSIGFNITSLEILDWSTIIPRSFGYGLSTADYDLSDGYHTPVPLYSDSGYDILFIGYAWGPEWDPSSLFETYSFFPVGFNFYNYWDNSYDALVKNYTQAVTYEARMSAASTLQQYLYQYQPTIPLVSKAELWIYADGWNGINFDLLRSAQTPWWEIYFTEKTQTTTTTISSTSTMPPSTTTTPSTSTPLPTTTNSNPTTSSEPEPQSNQSLSEPIDTPPSNGSNTNTSPSNELQLPFSFAWFMTGFGTIGLLIVRKKRCD